MEEYTSKQFLTTDTVPVNNLLGTHVLTPKGNVVGKISNVHLDDKATKLVGITITHGVLRKKVFVGADYIHGIHLQGTKLSVSPTFLLKGKKVITSDGKILGTVIDVERQGRTVKIISLTVRNKLLMKKYIPYQWVKHEGTNILLNLSHEQAKQHFAGNP